MGNDFPNICRCQENNETNNLEEVTSSHLLYNIKNTNIYSYIKRVCIIFK